MDGIENTHMTSQIHLAQKWPSKYFPDFLTGKLEICPSKIGSSAVAFLYHSAIFAEMAWSGGGSAFWLIEPFLQLEWCLIVPLKFRQRVAHQITGELWKRCNGSAKLAGMITRVYQIAKTSKVFL